MPVAVIADAHLGGPGGAPGRLLAQLDALEPPDCRQLVLLGDIFHVWVGRERYETPEITEVALGLERLRARGVRVDYVEGNRDFFIADGPYADLFDSVAQEVAFEDADRRYLAVHGDGMNQEDYAYRFWRWLSKSRLSRFMMMHLPRPLARAAVHGTERRLATTNFKHKSRIPEAAIRDFAAGRLGTDCDVLLLGHFHEPHTWELAGGEVRLLDAWFRSHRVEWFGGPPPA